MDKQEDVRASAEAFFALWQKQTATLMRDPDALLKTLLALQTACYTPRPDVMKPSDVTDAKEQPTAISPEPGALSVLELTTRLARCEARIAELESVLAGRSRTTRQKATNIPTTNAA